MGTDSGASTVPPASGSSPRKPTQLPRGRHGLPRAFVIQNQRDRVFDSLGAVCALKGYPATTVEDITAHAGVSRRTFYDLFADKEECFLAAYDVIVRRLVGEINGAFGSGERPWPERIAAGLRALTGIFAAEPELARLAMVDVLAAGQRALERRDATLRGFARFFEAGSSALPDGMQGHDVIAQAVVGGLYEALYSYIVDGEADRLPDVLPDLIYCALVPYLGHDRAMAARDAERARIDQAAPAAAE
jgi:AcrR family transcriptional regulator